MTNEEINKAIHKKVMGEGCWHELFTKEFTSPDGIYYTMLTCQGCGRHVSESGPDYTSDLNAVHLAEMKTIEKNESPYLDLLETVLIRDLQPEFDMPSVIDYMTATARQRAEAVLRATGNWESE